MSLKTYITDRYGAIVYEKTTLLKELKTEQAKTKNQSIFLERCVSHKLIPKSLRIKSPVNNIKTNGIVQRYQLELLITIKNDASRKYFNLSKRISELKLELAVILSEDDMITINNVTEQSREKMFNSSKLRLLNKFRILKEMDNKKQYDTQRTNYVKESVINLTTEPLPEHHKLLLNLGPNFVPNIKSIPYMDIISITESSALKLEYNKNIEAAQTLRKDVLRNLKMVKPNTDNLTKQQRQALREIRENKNISIYPFDKGSGLVRINTKDAKEKILEQIGNTKVIHEDPTTSFATRVRNTLCQLRKKRKFTKREYEMIYPSDPIPPRMYGVIKAHKDNYPMRIIVSTVGTPVYGLSQYLVDLIQPTLNENEIRIKNSSAFVEKAKTWEISSSEVQVSFDVVNLYPSVPLKEATEVIIRILSNDDELRNRTKLQTNEIKSLIELCLSKCYFLWNDTMYELENSGPIGLSLMVVMAESFLQHIEKRAVSIALHNNPPINLKSFLRYVDDSHARFENFDQVETFKNILNKQHNNIKYTVEYEDENKTLNFLDVKIINKENGKYEFDIHRKKAITNIQVKTTSSHDPKILNGIFKGFVHRALTICSNNYIDLEIQFLVDIFVENGYDRVHLQKMANEMKCKFVNNSSETNNDDNTSKNIITLPWIPKISPKLRKCYRKAGYKTVFKSGPNLKRLLTSRNKSKLPKNSQPGVYKVNCECTSNPYIGETKLQIRSRINQHQQSVSNNNCSKSALAFHKRTCEKNISWEAANTLKVETNKFNRKVREALEIQYHKCSPANGGLNLDDGQYVKTKFWTPFFQCMRKRNEQRNLIR